MDNIKVALVPIYKVAQSSLMTWLQGMDFSPQHLRVAQASNDKGTVMHVYFVRIDDAYLITGILFDPRAKKSDDKICGDAVEIFLEQLAQVEGVKQLYMTLPGGSECTLLLTYPTRITQVSKLQVPTPVLYLN